MRSVQIQKWPFPVRRDAYSVAPEGASGKEDESSPEDLDQSKYKNSTSM